MAVYRALLLLGCAGLAQSSYVECSPPIPNCDCEDTQKVMQCSGLSEFPVPPVGYEDFLFQSCEFPTVSSLPMQYLSSVSILLEECSISSLEDSVFSVFTNLKFLSLSGNALSNVTAAMLSGLSNLETLSLTRNQLTQLPTDMLRNTPSLTTLKLDGNPGLVLGDGFFDGLHLDVLHLSDLGLDSCPRAWIRDMPSLKSLFLSLNALGELEDDCLTGVPNLQQLSLDSCSLAHISDNAFQEQTKLATLTLSNNLLVSLSPEVTSWMRGSLDIVHLDNNQLETLDERTLNWDHLSEVRLGHNPWHCDCALQWVRTLDLQHLDHENVTCSLPEEHAGRPIHDAVESLSCGGGPSAVALGIGITILILCLVFIAYYVYRIVQNRRQRRLARRSHNYSAVYKDTVESAAPAKTPPPRPPAPNYKPV